MLDIAVATDAITAADLWTAPNEADQLSGGPGSFSGLELVARLSGGAWPTVQAFINAATVTSALSKAVVCTDGVTCAIYVGRGRCVVPAGRRYAVVDYEDSRYPWLLLIPGVTYTAGP